MSDGSWCRIWGRCCCRIGFFGRCKGRCWIVCTSALGRRGRRGRCRRRLGGGFCRVGGRWFWCSWWRRSGRSDGGLVVGGGRGTWCVVMRRVRVCFNSRQEHGMKLSLRSFGLSHPCPSLLHLTCISGIGSESCSKTLTHIHHGLPLPTNAQAPNETSRDPSRLRRPCSPERCQANTHALRGKDQWRTHGPEVSDAHPP